MSLFTKKRRTLLSAVAVLAVGAVYWLGCGGDNGMTPPLPGVNGSGKLVDSRDGQKYRVTTIGNQVWMAEDMRYRPAGSTTWCPGDANNNCKKYGVLYDWYTAMEVCPAGWRLPIRKDFDILVATARSTRNLRTTTGWEISNGTDEYGFSAVGAGGRNSHGNDDGIGKWSFYWTSAEVNSERAYWYGFYSGTTYLEGSSNGDPKTDGRSVRCLLDDGTVPATPAKYAVTVTSAGTGASGGGSYAAGETVTVRAGTAPSGQQFKNWTTTSAGVKFADSSKATTTFIMPKNAVTVTANFQTSATPPTAWEGDTIIDAKDGQKYRVVKIGNQVWMAEDMRYQPSTANTWCPGGADSNCVKYGRLYDWYTAMEICPTGWRLPIRKDFDTLVAFVKSTRNLRTTTGWGISNGTDDYGFSSVPAGWYNPDHSGNPFGTWAYYWTSAEVNSAKAYWYGFYSGTTYLEGSRDGEPKTIGFSVRCLLDDGAAPPPPPPTIYEDGILEGLPFRKGEIPEGTADLLQHVDIGSTIISGGSAIVTISSPVKLKYLYINVNGDGELGYYILDLSLETPDVVNGLYTYKPTLLISQNLSGGDTLQIKLGGVSADDRTSKTVNRYVNTLVVGSGSLQVSLSWNNSDDLDLHIVTPSGEIYYMNKTVGNGELDLDANVNCGGESNENIYFDGTLEDGLYLVWVDLYTKCGETGAEYNVTASAGGRPFPFSENSQRERGRFKDGEDDFTGVSIGVITVKNGKIVQTDYKDSKVRDLMSSLPTMLYGLPKKKK
jgi:uncharacterized protein (TIGR02145 family)